MAAWQEQLQPLAGSAGGPPPGMGGPGQPPPPPYGMPPPVKPKKRGLRIFGYVSIAVVVIALGAGALYYTSRPNAPTYGVGECVRESSGRAAQVACSTPGAFRIVSRVSDANDCADKDQPHADLVDSGTPVVLCLGPVTGPKPKSTGSASPTANSTS